jgi:hypothetical protein
MTVTGEVVERTKRKVRVRVLRVSLEDRALLRDAELDITVKDGLDYFAAPERHFSRRLQVED